MAFPSQFSLSLELRLIPLIAQSKTFESLISLARALQVKLSILFVRSLRQVQFNHIVELTLTSAVDAEFRLRHCHRGRLDQDFWACAHRSSLSFFFQGRRGEDDI